MRTIRLPLYVVDPDAADAILDVVTSVDGVIAAFLDVDEAVLEVVVSRDASALLVREQLVALPAA